MRIVRHRPTHGQPRIKRLVAILCRAETRAAWMRECGDAPLTAFVLVGRLRARLEMECDHVLRDLSRLRAMAESAELQRDIEHWENVGVTRWRWKLR